MTNDQSNQLSIEQEVPGKKTLELASTPKEYRPVSILLHAYRQLNKAYQGNVLFDTYSDTPHISSEDNNHQIAARRTLKDIQVAYKNGLLSEALISSLIARRLPDDLTDDNIDNHLSNLDLFLNITENQQKTLNAALEEISKRPNNVFAAHNTNGSVSLRAQSGNDFGTAYDILTHLKDTFDTGKEYSENKVKELVEAAFGDSNLFLSARSKRAQARRERDYDNKNHVKTHEVILLQEANGVNLRMMSEHLLSMDKKAPFPFSALSPYLSFAKAVVNKDTGLACISLQLPVFKRMHEPQHSQRQQALIKAISDTAQYFEQTPNAFITHEIVKGIAEKAWNDIKNPVTLTAANEDTPKAHNYITLAQIEELSHDSLFHIVEGLILEQTANDKAVTIQKIGEALNVNFDDALQRSALFVKLEKFVDDLEDSGALARSGDQYRLPEPFNGAVELTVYPKTKKRDYLMARPNEWNEEVFGAIPELILDEETIESHKIEADGTIHATLSYHAGNDKNFTVVKYTAPSKIRISKNSVTSHSPLHGNKTPALPTNNIWSGTVTKDNGKHYFVPSLEGNKRFEISANFNVSEGAIIKAHVSPRKRAITKIFGEYGSIDDRNSWSTISALEAGLELEFAEGILEGVDFSIPEPNAHRSDLRDQSLITIDPETAKDYDDAVDCEDREDGGWKLTVAIADVDHYVERGSALDKEATKRGNTTYLPGLTIPMLPEELSNGVCSLREKEDRAALVTTVILDRDGNITSYDFEMAVINSKARLTYDQAQNAIEGNPDEKTAPLLNDNILPLLRVSEAMGKEEVRRGKLKLDTTEQQIDINTEGEYNFRYETHNESHKLIERCMIASNICAIKFLKEHFAPFIVRGHGYPNETTLSELSPQLEDLGIDLPDETSPIKARVEAILKQAYELESTDDKNSVLDLVIRSQARAEYSDEESAHFALQLDEYTHETSPIRRDVDRHIHYLIKSILEEKAGIIKKTELTKRFKDFKKEAAALALNASERERHSEDIQRTVEKRHTLAWIKENIGRAFKATVTHVDNGDLQINITGQKIKTIIPKDELPDFEPTNDDGESPYKRGDSIKVIPTEANPVTGALKFAVSTKENTVKRSLTRRQSMRTIAKEMPIVTAGKVKQSSIRDVYFKAVVNDVQNGQLNISLLQDLDNQAIVTIPEPKPSKENEPSETPIEPKEYQVGEVVEVATTSDMLESAKPRFSLVQKPV